MNDIIEAKEQSFWEFSASTVTEEGIENIGASLESTHIHLKNVVYAEKDGMKLHINILLPTSERKLPLAVFIPGSAWREQDLGSTLPQLVLFAKMGFAVAQVEYRPSSLAAFPAQIKDTRTAARFLLMNADEYNIDAEKVFIWGDSSGAHTALMTAFTEGEAYFEDEKGESLNLKAAIDFYGPTDIARMNCEPSIMDHISEKSPEGMLIGGKNVLENPELAARTVVHAYVSKDKAIPPVLMIHGDKDRLVPFGQSVMLYRRLKAEEKEVRLIRMLNADHGVDDFWTERVFRIVADFAKEHF